MIKPKQVPEEVWKVLRREVEGSGLRHWNEIVAAALNAWPGMVTAPPVRDDKLAWGEASLIILPLPQENSDE